MAYKRKRLSEMRKELDEAKSTGNTIAEGEPIPLELLNIEKIEARTPTPTMNSDETRTAVDPIAIVPPVQPTPPARPTIQSIRRKANPDNWKQTVRKRLRQSGKEYVNANGKLMAERRVRPGCGSTCYLKCSDRFAEEQRQFIHTTFWHLTDEQKNNFYWKYTSRVEPKRRRTGNTTSKRANTFLYRFEVRGEMLPVCRKFFFATLDITSRRIYYFYEHCYQEDTCMPREIRRGRNPKPALPDIGERLDEIRQHISSFPSVRLGGSSLKRYLPADLNLTRMYKMYVEAAKNPLKQHWYIRVFNEEFNLGFRLPTSSNKGCTSNGVKETKKPALSTVGENTDQASDDPLYKSESPVNAPPTNDAPQQQWTKCLQDTQNHYPANSNWSEYVAET